MNKEKLKLLYQAQQKLINIAFGDGPVEDLKRVLSTNIEGYGTVPDEVIKNIDDFVQMVIRQRKEMEGMHCQIQERSVFRKYIDKKQLAIHVDEFDMILESGGVQNILLLRLTLIWEWQEDKWLCIQFHGSTQDVDTDEGQAWPLEEWKRRNVELEAKVKKQTEEIIEQKKELEIEVALERVRSRAMAMHSTEELSDTIGEMFKQLWQLDVNPINTYLVLYDLKNDQFTWRMTGQNGHAVEAEMTLSFQEMPEFLPTKKAWLTGEEVIDTHYNVEGTKRWLKLISPINSRLESKNQLQETHFPKGIFACSGRHDYGSLGILHSRPIQFEEKKLLVRFAKEFELVYRRFLDLKQAEFQAREAQIETSLERIRAASMGMQHSEDFPAVANVVLKQIEILGIPIFGIGINIIKSDAKTFVLYFADNSPKGDQTDLIITEELQVQDFWIGREVVKKLLAGEEEFTVMGKGNRIKWWIHWVGKNVSKARSIRLKQLNLKILYVHTIQFHELSNIIFSSVIPLSDQQWDACRRMAKTYGMSYRRFLDLKQAEKRAWEAQIEAALERVRSRSMAMHHSQELHEVAVLLFENLELLGLQMNSAVIHEFKKGDSDHYIWMANKGKMYPEQVIIPHIEHRWFNCFTDPECRKKRFFSVVFSKEEKNSFYTHIISTSSLQTTPNDRKDFIFSCDGMTVSFALFEDTALSIMRYDIIPFRKAENEILRRFGQVFEQAYTRFQDLKQAEKRAREAVIEAALERVRARAMSMHSSKDLTGTVSLLIFELHQLSINPLRCGFGRVRSEEKTAELYIASINDKNDEANIELMCKLKLEGHSVFEGIYEAHENQVDYFPVLEGDLKTSYYRELGKYVKVPEYKKEEKEFGYFFMYQGGGLYAWSFSPLGEEELQIFKKFTAVLALTFKRFQDLQDAEIRALEAIHQASLDRVRAEIASMRTSEDLESITPLIWNELTTLKVPFFRCGVFIINEDSESIQTYLTTPEGKSLAVMELPFGTIEFMDQTVNAWRNGESYMNKWNKQQFIEFSQSILEQGLIESKEIYQGADNAPDRLVMLFVPFNQGMLYVGNSESLDVEQIEIVQSLADAFSVAYARYEDFYRLEKAKEKVEMTLSELKSTQAQLVQAEKMASLGELTAGIAHEIQNPLNFVNNFSELNDELIAEIKEELENGDIEEVKAILDDLSENEKKITHHGKRAEGIVRSMLQHSRTSKGQKEWTDINTLADEYLRLAYHGMRAKDKSFHANFELILDAELPKLEVNPQDIGRVLLNLINNAFYAVGTKPIANSQKLNAIDSIPAPKVIVSTLKNANSIQISVEDNGPGIPDDIKEKIFLPFFTTKATGEGTGLGLSLAYDIISKGHNGSIEVLSPINQENKGTRFVITIPKL